ncbi:MAG: 16S rRNA (cytosine(1402)-N(4))-methyltransferase RsmH [Deltaproteobacteria bacterium]|nr:16S rRNA (cytosine(1402)-N(4))-methyltransferase RsmH [Deltaproteobacteria bacterium]
MVREVMELLQPQAHRRYLDGTLGGGGHSEQILTLSSPDGLVLGLDWDDEAIAATRERLKRFAERLLIRRANFTEASEILREVGWHKVDGILLDLGLSSHHLESRGRGFSFQFDSRLDMRMDRRQSIDAYQVVNTYPVSKLERIFREYGEERRARRIALAIDAQRKRKKIGTTGELAELVTRALGGGRSHIHPATRTFQALRIAVNRELDQLAGFLENAYELLLLKGRMVVISFHSLEDRLVKKAFRKWSRDCICPPKTLFCYCGWSQKARLLTSRPLLPSEMETRINPRARSAKLRAAERV